MEDLRKVFRKVFYYLLEIIKVILISEETDLEWKRIEELEKSYFPPLPNYNPCLEVHIFLS
jgi:hypothetical protein